MDKSSGCINDSVSRRRFLGACAVAVAANLAAYRRAWARTPATHPAPRAGITASKVLTRQQLGDTPKFIPLFDSVREIPQVIDGIRCSCGCTDPPGFYSLLSCFEGRGMARDCAVCQGQARLAVRFHREGKSLEQIRAAIDAKFG